MADKEAMYLDEILLGWGIDPKEGDKKEPPNLTPDPRTSNQPDSVQATLGVREFNKQQFYLTAFASIDLLLAVQCPGVPLGPLNRMCEDNTQRNNFADFSKHVPLKF